MDGVTAEEFREFSRFKDGRQEKLSLTPGKIVVCSCVIPESQRRRFPESSQGRINLTMAEGSNQPAENGR